MEIHQSRDEWFRFLSVVFDVSKARELLLARGGELEIARIEVSKLRPLVSERKKGPDGKIKGITLGVSVDWDRIERDAEFPDEDAVIDTNVPIILAHLEEDGTALPIDGYHRIGKAILKGIETLPCVLLTEAESKKVRVR